MAGESRGELAEAIAKVALGRALAIRRRREQVYWEESPSDAVIKPDLTTGTSKDAPSNLVLVNASDSPKESEKKFWRNVGEVFDSKTRLVPRPAVVNLVFKSEIKPELVNLMSAICDSTHLVDRDPRHGDVVAAWLAVNHSLAPSRKLGKEQLVRKAISKGSKQHDSDFSAGLEHLSQTLAPLLFEHRDGLEPLWDLARADFLSRAGQASRKAKNTLFRRGLARWVVFDDEIRLGVAEAHFRNRPVAKSSVPDYAKGLGLLSVRLNGAYIPAVTPDQRDMVATTASDLRAAGHFFLTAAGGDAARAARELHSTLLDAPPEMTRKAELLRAMPDMVDEWQSYVLDRWRTMCSTAGCYEELVLCRSDSSMGGVVRDVDPDRVWLYDHLVALLRAHSGRNNDFGYGALVGHFKAHQSDGAFVRLLRKVVEGLRGRARSTAERWVKTTLPTSAEPGRRGFQDWLAGRKEVSPAIVAAFAYSLSSLLRREIRSPRSIKLGSVVAAHAYGLWNKLITYQDFEPLANVCEAACGSRIQRVSAPTVLSDLAERAVQNAGIMPALAFSGGLICWKSVTDLGKGHKRKELSGRARALRFQMQNGVFGPRRTATQLILVVDGTFEDDDLQVLQESGWDQVFYPDEMDELVKAIA